MSRDRLRHEDGMALIAVLFAVVILLGLAVLFVATSVNQSRFTGVDRDRETALHAAEAGIDGIITKVNKNDEFFTTATVAEFTPGANAAASDIREWAIDAAEALIDEDPPRDDFVAEDSEGWTYAAFRPWEEVSGAPVAMKEIVGVGWSPRRGHPDARVRVVRIKYDQQLWSPTKAILLGGAFRINGGALVGGKDSGIKGDVHANGDVTATNNAYTITGTLSSTGSTPPATATSPDVAPNSMPQFTPTINVRAQYSRYTEVIQQDVTNLPASGYEGDWYDLCPDDTIRPPHPAGPCQHPTVIWRDSPSYPNNFKGWKVNSGRWSGNDISSGVFYVYRKNANVNGSKVGASVTIFGEGLEGSTSTAGATGNISFGGNVATKPRLGSIALLADRDIVLEGTVSATFEGFIGAKEQIDFGGNASFTGASYAADEPSTPGSLIHDPSTGDADSRISGNLSILYSPDLVLKLAGIVRVTAWNEV